MCESALTMEARAGPSVSICSIDMQGYILVLLMVIVIFWLPMLDLQLQVRY